MTEKMSKTGNISIGKSAPGRKRVFVVKETTAHTHVRKYKRLRYERWRGIRHELVESERRYILYNSAVNKFVENTYKYSCMEYSHSSGNSEQAL